MISAMNSLLSGMSAQTRALNVIAGNVANASSDGYAKKSSNFVEGPASVAETSRETSTRLAHTGSVSETGPAIRQSNSAFVEGSGVDLVAEMVDLMVTKNAYKANAKAFAMVSDLSKSTLDILA